MVNEYKVEWERVKNELSSAREDGNIARVMAEKASEEKRIMFEAMQGEIDQVKNQLSVESVIHQ